MTPVPLSNSSVWGASYRQALVGGLVGDRALFCFFVFSSGSCEIWWEQEGSFVDFASRCSPLIVTYNPYFFNILASELLQLPGRQGSAR